VDDVAGIAAAAARRGVPCHVDGCLGGFLLPFVEQLGYDVPVFDFRLPGEVVNNNTLFLKTSACGGLSTTDKQTASSCVGLTCCKGKCAHFGWSLPDKHVVCIVCLLLLFRPPLLLLPAAARCHIHEC
jgi:hypothetical protein